MRHNKQNIINYIFKELLNMIYKIMEAFSSFKWLHNVTPEGTGTDMDSIKISCRSCILFDSLIINTS